MALDLNTVGDVAAREDEGITVSIRDPRHGEEPVATIRVVGEYSTRYRKALDAHILRRKKASRIQTEAEQTASWLQTLADCCLGWDGFTDGGVPLPFSPENAVLVFGKAPWIREQVETAMADHAGFFANGSPS